jgi:hypothetical protein
MKRFTLSAAAGVLWLLVLTGCGPQEPRGTSRSVTIALDHTTAESSGKIARDYAKDARQLAEPVLVDGGHLRIVLFEGAGVAPAVLVDERVPSQADLTGNARKRYLINARNNLRTLLDAALGLGDVTPGDELAQQLDAMAGGGSDVAGSISQEVDLLRQRGGGTLELRSDGLQRSDAVDFSKTIVHDDPAEAAEALAALLPQDASGVTIAISGLGITGGEVTTARAKKLETVWTAACEATKADACTAKTLMTAKGNA